MATSCQGGSLTHGINILLIGRIGQGKSATGNSILRNINFETSNHSSSATTKHVQWSSGGHTTRKGKHYMLNVADGPGLQDTELSNAQDKRRAYQNIERVIQDSESGIHAFILVIRLGVRFSEEERDTVNYLKRVLGEQFLKNYGIIVVTHGDSLDDGDDDSQGKLYKFQKWCKQQGDLIELCDRCVLFNNNTKDEHIQIEQLESLLDIIEGMLQRNKDSPYTTKMFQTFAEDHKKLKAEFHIEFVKEEFRRHLNNVWHKIEHITNMDSLNRSVAALDAVLKQVQFENKETNISDRLQKDLEGLRNHLMDMKQYDPGTQLFKRHSAEAVKMIQTIAYRASYKTGQKHNPFTFDKDYNYRYYESLGHGSRDIGVLMKDQGGTDK